MPMSLVTLFSIRLFIIDMVAILTYRPGLVRLYSNQSVIDYISFFWQYCRCLIACYINVYLVWLLWTLDTLLHSGDIVFIVGHKW